MSPCWMFLSLTKCLCVTALLHDGHNSGIAGVMFGFTFDCKRIYPITWISPLLKVHYAWMIVVHLFMVITMSQYIFIVCSHAIYCQSWVLIYLQPDIMWRLYFSKIKPHPGSSTVITCEKWNRYGLIKYSIHSCIYASSYAFIVPLKIK